MLLDEYVTLKANSSYIRRFKELGYDCKYNELVTIKISDLPPGSGTKVRCSCDLCGAEKEMQYFSYNKILQNNDGKYICRKCYCKFKHGEKSKKAWDKKTEEEKKEIFQKTIDTNLSKHGVRSTTQIPEVREKQLKTMEERYGVKYSMQNPELLEKARQTNLKKLGVDFPMQSSEVMAKSRETVRNLYGVDWIGQNEDVKEKIKQTCFEVYGEEIALKNPEVRKKAIKSLCNNQTVSTSKQQIYLHNLYGGELNKPVSYYNCDIVFSENKIIVEYDGSGHDLKVKLGGIDEQEFKQKEMIRFFNIKREGYKQIHIVSNNDKLPSDEILLEMFEISKKYFNDYPNHSWIKWDISNNVYYNAENKNGVVFNYGTLRRIKKAS